jgi:hypothetical protein
MTAWAAGDVVNLAATAAIYAGLAIAPDELRSPLQGCR